ncbi:LytR C-terminal domain-containing protein [Candidatus Roizmanbacteria bacterium]|nr:LytR C-terminal domain-containing protein [Candidatus Roizmanbacteria bacterium]
MIETTSSYSNPQGGSKNKKITIIIIVLIVAALAGGIFMLRQPEKKDEAKVDVAEKKKPTPTEKPKIDKKSVRIQVLNGTGTPGQASTAVEALKKAGYNADSIKTGNAEEFDTIVTTITARAGFADVANDIKGALDETFDEVKIDSSELEEKSEFDIVIVTGGKKFEEEETKTTPTLSPTTETVSPTPSPTTSVTATPTTSPTTSP